MSEEQKQALANDLTAYIGQPLNNPMTRSQWMEVARIALAALTAQPVKLPQIIQIGYTHDEITAMCNVRNDAVAAIRAAGYQVEGE